MVNLAVCGPNNLTRKDLANLDAPCCRLPSRGECWCHVLSLGPLKWTSGHFPSFIPVEGWPPIKKSDELLEFWKGMVFRCLWLVFFRWTSLVKMVCQRGESQGPMAGVEEEKVEVEKVEEKIEEKKEASPETFWDRDSNYWTNSGWWFQTCFIFHNILGNPSHWLIFFKIVF